MRGLSNKGSTSNRSKSTCSFCKSPNHQVSKCPHVPIVWASLQKGIVPLEYMSKVSDNDHSETCDSSHWRNRSDYWQSPLSSWYSQGANWGDLFKQSEKAFHKWARAKEREESKGKGKGAKRTATQTCGYCKETGHTRRSCTHQSDITKLLKQANRNFRQWFYNEYVVKQGLSTGAVIEFDFLDAGGYNRPSKRTPIRTLVTAINWDTINLFAMLDTTAQRRTLGWKTDIDGAKQEKMGNIANFLQSPVLCKVPKSAFTDCQVQTSYYYDTQSPSFYGVQLPICSSGTPRLHRFDEQEPLRSYGDSNKTENFRIVSRAPQVLADDWIDGYSDEMSVIFKRFTKAQLEFYGVQDLIREWANKTV